MFVLFEKAKNVGKISFIRENNVNRIKPINLHPMDKSTSFTSSQ
jgi:hypothetical protein